MAKKDEILNRQTFIKKFNAIARHKHRYEVFSDFIIYAALEIHNSFIKIMEAQEFFKNFEELEDEFIRTVNKYSKKERLEFVNLFYNLLVIFAEQEEPRDVLGSLFMELELSNDKNGQFFTPPEIAEAMAMMMYNGNLKNKSFLKIAEPACGAGGLILAFAKVMLKNGCNPTEMLWVQAVDIDRISAFMCYIQLYAYSIPAQIIVGNSLSLEVRETYYTPAHYLGNWNEKLRLRKTIELMKSFVSKPLQAESTQQEKPEDSAQLLKKEVKPEESIQFDLFFDHTNDKT